MDEIIQKHGYFENLILDIAPETERVAFLGEQIVGAIWEPEDSGG